MRHSFTLLVLVLLASGCSITQSNKIDYKSSAQKSLPSLEVPPDLVLPAKDNRYAVPDVGGAGSTTFSAYDKDRSGKAQSGNQVLLPKFDKVSLQRAGSERWLVVDMPAASVWPLIKDFWQEMGFVIDQESPQTGVMETDWAENRAKIPDEGIRKYLGKVIDFVYSTSERDKFRTRIETAADGHTEIYLSHRGMVEVYEGTQTGGDEGKGRTVWQPRPADPELEAEMLRRLMVRLGVDEAQAKTLVADKGQQASQVTLIKTGQAGPGVNVPDSFDRAWRRVGLALDRIGFVVEDRDRTAGTYFVRYADPEAKKVKGFLDKLAFWHSDEKPKDLKYQVHVKEGAGVSQVNVLMADGAAANNETGTRIATLLYEQLK